jgi:LPXTG-motif cell wall-anchored protein
MKPEEVLAAINEGKEGDKFTALSQEGVVGAMAAKGIKDKFVIPGTDSGISFQVESGSYQLTEVKAPDGYVIATSDVYFKINGNAIVLTDSAGNPLTTTTGEGEEAEQVPVTENDQAKVADLTLTIYNTAGTELPSTGGIGTTIYTATGIALMGAAFVMMTLQRRRVERGAV